MNDRATIVLILSSLKIATVEVHKSVIGMRIETPVPTWNVNAWSGWNETTGCYEPEVAASHTRRAFHYAGEIGGRHVYLEIDSFLRPG